MNRTPSVELIHSITRSAYTESAYTNWIIGANRLVFFALDDGLEGSELWCSDGSSKGTRLVKYFHSTSEQTGLYFSDVHNGILYFTTMKDGGQSQLWQSDGSEAGTVMIKDFTASYSSHTMYIEQLYFCGDELYIMIQDRTGIGELWRSDGSEAGMYFVTDIDASLACVSTLTCVDGIVYFITDDHVHGSELWRTDGRAGGTWLVKDIHVGNDGSAIERIEVANGILYFIAFDGDGHNLWRSDGTEAGTFKLSSFNFDSGLFFLQHLTIVGKSVYFVGIGMEDNTESFALWHSDGTIEGTHLLKNFPIGERYTAACDGPSYLTAVENKLFFVLHNGGHVQELWCSEGSISTTRQIENIFSEQDIFSSILELTALGKYVYFFTHTDSRGFGLWRSDGTEVATTMVTAQHLGKRRMYDYGLTASSNALYFLGDLDDYSKVLWKIVPNSDE